MLPTLNTPRLTVEHMAPGHAGALAEFFRRNERHLAPWDPPRRLVTRGMHRYVRNPMISGVLFMLLGESIFTGSRAIFIWFLAFMLINTTYFKLLEEPGLVRRPGRRPVAAAAAAAPHQPARRYPDSRSFSSR